jgi:hypothetical protein
VGNNSTLWNEAMSVASLPRSHHHFRNVHTDTNGTSILLEGHPINNVSATVNGSNHTDLLRSIPYPTVSENSQGLGITHQHINNHVMRPLLLTDTPSNEAQYTMLLLRLQQEPMTTSDTTINHLLLLQRLNSLSNMANPGITSNLDGYNHQGNQLALPLAHQLDVSRRNQVQSIDDFNRFTNVQQRFLSADLFANSSTIPQHNGPISYPNLELDLLLIDSGFTTSELLRNDDILHRIATRNAVVGAAAAMLPLLPR